MKEMCRPHENPTQDRFSASTSTRQSPRHKGDQPAMETRTDMSIHWILTYVNLRQDDAPKVQLPKNAKYPTPLSHMSEDFIEEGDLLANIPQLRYQDYNLQDPEKYPQFQADHYMTRKVDLITQVEKIVLDGQACIVRAIETIENTPLRP